MGTDLESVEDFSEAVKRNMAGEDLMIAQSSMIIPQEISFDHKAMAKDLSLYRRSVFDANTVGSSNPKEDKNGMNDDESNESGYCRIHLYGNNIVESPPCGKKEKRKRKEI